MYQFLIFEVGLQHYAIDLCDVREIVTYEGFTKMPDSRPWVVGLIQTRGQPMPIIDLRIRFETDKNPLYAETTVIIATKLSEGKLLGLVVDDVKDIRHYTQKQILSADKIDENLNSLLVKGYIKDNDENILILDQKAFGVLNEEHSLLRAEKDDA